ncbi:hypothetical protein U1Q18_002904, partial [Sarracenia purpurea var. burkii]
MSLSEPPLTPVVGDLLIRCLEAKTYFWILNLPTNQQRVWREPFSKPRLPSSNDSHRAEDSIKARHWTRLELATGLDQSSAQSLETRHRARRLEPSRLDL